MRGVVLSLREQPYVEAAVAAGTRTPMIILRHILPNTLAPMTVQATYICGSAMIIEAILSFIGAGTPPTIPSWGNIMAEGRALWQVKPFIVFFPAAFLSITVLAVNLLGDGLRDALDPRAAKAAVSDHGAARGREPADPFPHARTASTAPSTASPSTSRTARRWRSSAKAAAASRSPRCRSCASIPEPPGKIAGAIRLEGRDLLTLDDRAMRDIRGNDISMIFQEPMTSLNPVLTHRPPDRRDAAPASGPRPQRAAQARAVEMLALVGIAEPAPAACASIRTSSRAACGSG